MNVKKHGGILVVFAGLGAVLLATNLQAQGDKGLAGTWKLNAAKSTFSPGPPPKTMSVTYSSVGADGLKVVVDVAPAEGAAQHWEMTARYDGKEYPIKGNPNADTVTIKRIDDLTTESTFKKAGKVTATNTRSLSKDGKTLTVTSVGTTIDGKPRKDVQVFEK
jgi:hypothetical protein